MPVSVLGNYFWIKLLSIQGWSGAQIYNDDVGYDDDNKFGNNGDDNENGDNNEDDADTIRVCGC